MRSKATFSRAIVENIGINLKWLSLVGVFAGFLASCSPRNVGNPTNTIAVTPKSSQSTPKLPPTATSPYPTPNVKSTTQQCIELVLDTDQLPPSSNSPIVIHSLFILKWVESDFQQPFLFYSSTTKITLELSSNYGSGSFATSPQQNFVAFLDAEAGKYYLSGFDRGGNKIINDLVLPDGIENLRIHAWYEKGMIIEKKNAFGSYNESTGYMLVDPFTMEQLPLQVKFPNLYPRDSKYHGNDEISYDPSLTRAVYYGWEKDTNELYYSLWDIINDKELARLPTTAYPQGKGIWSPDGELWMVRIWLGKQFGLVGIHRDGQIETLLAGDVFKYQFSPDGQRLAYWLKDRTTKLETLFVKDLVTNETIDYCLGTESLVGMVWSPDGQNMALSFEYQGTVITTVVNFSQKTAIKIDDVSNPVGWLK